MSHAVGVVSDETVALGFRLAGFDPRIAHSSSEAQGALVEMMEDERWGVILVQEDLVPDGVPSVKRTEESGLPLVVPFPAPRAERPPDDALAYVTELLRSAVGYRVRLR